MQFKLKSFIVRCTEQHKVRLRTEILGTSQCNATWYNITYKYSEHRLHL